MQYTSPFLSAPSFVLKSVLDKLYVMWYPNNRTSYHLNDFYSFFVYGFRWRIVSNTETEPVTNQLFCNLSFYLVQYF